MATDKWSRAVRENGEAEANVDNDAVANSTLTRHHKNAAGH